MFGEVEKKSLSKTQTPNELPLASKNAPLPAVLVMAFPERQNLETAMEFSPVFLKENKLVLWDEPSALAEDIIICICLTTQHHVLQNHDFQKYIHKGIAYQLF